SPTFRIESNFVAARVAGRGARANVIVDNYQLIRDPIYGGLTKAIDHGEAFHWVVFDVARWKGQAAYLEFLDDGPGDVAVGEVRFADRPPPAGGLGGVLPPPPTPALPADAPTE